MKTETKYVAFNGAVFNDPESAKQYETMTYLKVRHRDCIDIVGKLSESVRHKRARIGFLMEQLTACNAVLRDQSSNDADIFNAKNRRFNMRVELELLIPEYINEKNMLRKYNKKLSYYYNRRVMEKRRIMEENNQIKKDEHNSSH